MKYRKCDHVLNTRFTYDVGSGNQSVYDLCNNCKEFPVFRKFVISQEPIDKNTPVLEIEN